MNCLMGMQAGSQPEAAIEALSDAMRSSLNDSDVGLLLAEVYLDLVEVTLTETALDITPDRDLTPA